MRTTILGLVLFISLISTWGLAAQQREEKAGLERVPDLIGKLGSVKFAERDRAMKELEAIGPAALPTLRPALKSPDTEVRRRVVLLVRKFEDQQLAGSLLAGKRVRLNVKDFNIAQAVAELEKVSGYPVALLNQFTNGWQRVTLDTGDTTFWEALQQLCLKTGLAEVGSASGDAANQKAATTALVKAANSSTGGPLQLIVGKGAELPTFFAGSVRFRLLKITPVTGGYVDCVVEVCGEPRLLSFASAGGPRVDKVIDNHGQTLASVPLTAPAAAAVAGAGNVQVNAGNIALARAQVTGIPRESFVGKFQPFQLTIRLKSGEKPAQQLKEVLCTIPVQCTVDAEPLGVVDNVLKAAGRTIKGKDDSDIKILAAEELGNGDVLIRIGIENGPGQVPPAAAFPRGVQAMRNVVIADLSNTDSAVGGMRLLDAAGKPFLQTGSVNVVANKAIRTLSLTFRPGEGQGPAAKLVLPGYRIFAFDVPLTLNDLQLQVK